MGNQSHEPSIAHKKEVRNKSDEEYSAKLCDDYIETIFNHEIEEITILKIWDRGGYTNEGHFKISRNNWGDNCKDLKSENGRGL